MIDCFDQSDVDQVQTIAVQEVCILSVYFFEKDLLFFFASSIQDSQIWMSFSRYIDIAAVLCR